MAFELIAIGSSWGGMRAVASVLEALPADFEIPIVLAQHRPPSAPDEMLEQVLGRRSTLQVVAATDKEPLAPGCLFVAPPDYHLLVEPGHLALSTDAPVEFSRPSVDVLFESVADVYGPRAVGVVLTGANQDGAAGLARIAAAGGFTVAQDPATAERAEMPQAAVARGAARLVLPLDRIGPFLAELPAGVAQ
jgi:two-component system, chemotaxis family, protein-glutamate methylesterase/glutaminase